MGKSESEARRDKVQLEVTQKVLNSFGETDVSKSSRDMARREAAEVKRGGRTSERR